METLPACPENPVNVRVARRRRPRRGDQPAARAETHCSAPPWATPCSRQRLSPPSGLGRQQRKLPPSSRWRRRGPRPLPAPQKSDPSAGPGAASGGGPGAILSTTRSSLHRPPVPGRTDRLLAVCLALQPYTAQVWIFSAFSRQEGLLPTPPECELCHGSVLVCAGGHRVRDPGRGWCISGAQRRGLGGLDERPASPCCVPGRGVSDKKVTPPPTKFPSPGRCRPGRQDVQ